MNDKLVEAIDQLTERESKRMLLRLFMETQIAETDQHDEKRLSHILRRMFEDLIHLNSEEPLAAHDRTHYHIVCGASAAGSLKVGLNGIGAKSERVVALSADLSVGPLRRLDESAGVEVRAVWMDERLTLFNEEIEHPITECVHAIRAIPPKVPITIWTCDNAREQTGLCFILHLLKDHANEIRVINPSRYYKRLLEENGEGVVSVSSGGISSTTFGMLFKKFVHQEPMNRRNREKFDIEWTRFSEESADLRIWTDHHVQAVQADYFDRTILQFARRLARRKASANGFSCLQLVGEFICETNEGQLVSDTFALWRIRSLIQSGKLVVKKSPNQLLHATLTIN